MIDVQSLVTDKIRQQAQHMVDQEWDYHPEAALPPGYMLVSYVDGAWLCEEECNLDKAVRLVKVLDPKATRQVDAR